MSRPTYGDLGCCIRASRSDYLRRWLCVLLCIAGFTIAASHLNTLSAQELNASDGAAGDQFGYSVSQSGNNAIVGAYLDDDDGSASGSAYVFRNLNTAAGTVTESVKLTASDGTAGDVFGISVSQSGNNAIVGAYQDDDNGSAYVFRNLDTATGTINESVKLTASDGTNDSFGFSVSQSGNNAIVGAIFAEGNSSDSGSAYVYRNLDTATGTINESVKLTASDGAAVDQFGFSVSQSGNIAIVGAYADDDNGSTSGSAYIFRNLDTAIGTLNESVKLTASDGAAGDQFGNSVSQSGNNAIVGAYGDDDNGSNSGSAYVFRNLDTATGTLNESVKLTASDGAAGDLFGYSAVGQSGNNAIVGARFDDDNGSNSGSAYVFRNLDTATGTINESVKLTASDGAGNDQFGFSVSIDGDRFAVGAWNGDGVVTNSGSAYTGTISSLTTLDAGSVMQQIDGISFESRTDWIIGDTTSDNHVLLTASDAGEVRELGTGIFVGNGATSNQNSLTIDGSISAISAQVGADGNFGNQLVFSSTATNMIDSISLFESNSLLLEGNFITFAALDAELGSTDLFAIFGSDSPQLITSGNFDELLMTSFDSGSGFTTFTVTAVPEPSAAIALLISLGVITTRRRRRRGTV